MYDEDVMTRVCPDNATPMLTIAIPTWNRRDKLSRLLSVLEALMLEDGLLDEVKVLVSDNGSTDGTQTLLAALQETKGWLDVFCEAQNRGFDRNVQCVYEHSVSRWVWLFSDDDLPLKGGFRKILDGLKTHSPDVLIFSFQQPPGATNRSLNYPTPLHIIHEPRTQVEHVARHGKLSQYVIRKHELRPSQQRLLDEHAGGWLHQMLALSALEASAKPTLGIISDHLATADEDWNTIRYAPDMIGTGVIGSHPYALRHYPDLGNTLIDEGYCDRIAWLFAEKAGLYVSTVPLEYQDVIDGLKWSIGPLAHNPRALMQLVALKTGLAKYWLRMRPYLRHAKSGRSK